MKRSTTLALAAVLLAGCGSLFGTDDPDAGPSPNGVGSRCASSDQCRAGLRCESGACAPGGATAAGEGCVLTGECAAGLYCSPLGLCAAAGSATEGASCGDTAGCSPGLVCVRPAGELFGYCRAPRGAGAGDGGVAVDAGASAGPSDLNGPCHDDLDCLAGLACDAGARRCVQPAQLPVTSAPWPGETCDDGPTGHAVRAYFEVPAADGSPPHDFFRLPFPNDIRRDASTGRVNLAGFPHPGTALLGFDLVDRYLRAAERDLDGFGTNSIIYFRFSGRLDFATLRLNDTIHLVDLTTGMATSTIRFGASTAGNRYLCANPVYVDTGHGVPMEPGHTYAAWLTTGVRAEGGGAVTRDDDFGLMLAAAAPADPAKARAWAAYAPLRQHLATANIEPSTLLTAAVFTTQRPRRVVEALRAAVQAAPPPAASGFVRCDAGVRSPCDDGLTGDAHVRGCVGAADPRFDELQGVIELPVFQSGARPYREAGSGAITLDAQGRATPTGTERVCVTVTVPRAAMPASGWPVAVYFHGTGGSFRSVVTEGLAGALASVDLGGGAPPVNVATVGVEGVMHGARRGDGVTDPSDRLFFNFANPQAARDNVLQGAADLFAVVRALGAVNLSELPRAGQSVRFDPARVAFVGHSQGSTVGLPALAYEPGISAALLSGAGGDLRLSLTTKRQPIDIARAVPAVLQDPDAASAGHPVLNVLQMFFERADAVNFGRRVLLDRPEGVPLRPVLQTYGLGDTYSTPPTMQAVAQSLGLPAAGPIPGGASAWPPGMGLALPVMNNLTVGSMSATAALIEADPAGAYDGHFVLFRDPALSARALGFVASALRGAAVVR